MEEDTHNKKKENRKIGILLFISIALILTGIVLIKPGKILYKKKEVNATRKSEIEFTESELDRYINYINPVNSVGPSSKLYTDTTIYATDLSAKEKIEYIGYSLYDKLSTTPDNNYTVLSEDTVKYFMEKVYGPETYQRTEFNLGCSTYNFSESDRNYYAKVGCEIPSTFQVKREPINYYATKEKLEITTAYVFYHVTAKKIYKDYEKTILLDIFSTETEIDPNNYLEKYIKDNKDKLNHIIYTFESTDGENYYFTGFTNDKA